MLKESFLEYLSYERRYSEHTVCGYGLDLSKFEEYLKGRFERSPARNKACAGYGRDLRNVGRDWPCLLFVESGGLHWPGLRKNEALFRSNGRRDRRAGAVDHARGIQALRGDPDRAFGTAG